MIRRKHTILGSWGPAPTPFLRNPSPQWTSGSEILRPVYGSFEWRNFDIFGANDPIWSPKDPIFDTTPSQTEWRSDTLDTRTNPIEQQFHTRFRKVTRVFTFFYPPILTAFRILTWGVAKGKKVNMRVKNLVHVLYIWAMNSFIINDSYIKKKLHENISIN